jgi:hypothetical protein
MSWDYINKVVSIAFDQSSKGVAVIEFVLLVASVVVLLCCWMFKIAKENIELLKAPKKTAVGKFLLEDKWRIIFITLLLAAYHFLVRAPYLLYEKDQMDLVRLKSENEKHQLEASLSKEQVRQTQKNHWQDWAACGMRSFELGDCTNSAGFFELAFNDPDAQYGYPDVPQWAEKVENCPLYFFDLLEINLQGNPNSLQSNTKAINKFHSNLDEMTNEMHCANSEKRLFTSYNSKSQLAINLERLEMIKPLVPDAEQNYVQTIIDAVRSISTNRNINR